MKQQIKLSLQRHVPLSVYRTLRSVYHFPSSLARLRIRLWPPAKSPFRHPTILTDAFGIRFICYPWDATPVADQTSRAFYKPEFAAQKLLIHPGDTVFDVGANIGLHSIFMARLVGDHGQVHAFEPVPNTYAMLRETLALNRIEHVQTRMEALGNTQSVLPMNVFADQYNAWSSFGRPQYDQVKPVGTVPVPTRTLDEYVAANHLARINFLKIDVEGYEKQVLEGAARSLSAGLIDALSFEISQIPLQGAGASARAIFALLASHGYSAYRFDSTQSRFYGPFGDSREFYENYYASRQNLTTLPSAP